MNLAVILALAIFMVLEKFGPLGEQGARLSGAPAHPVGCVAADRVIQAAAAAASRCPTGRPEASYPASATTARGAAPRGWRRPGCRLRRGSSCSAEPW